MVLRDLVSLCNIISDLKEPDTLSTISPNGETPFGEKYWTLNGETIKLFTQDIKEGKMLYGKKSFCFWKNS